MHDYFKNLILSGGEPHILVENGEPRFVVMPWREFELMRGSDANRRRAHFAEVVDDDIDFPLRVPLRRSLAPLEMKSLTGFAPIGVDTAKIRLEDLPV